MFRKWHKDIGIAGLAGLALAGLALAGCGGRSEADRRDRDAELVGLASAPARPGLAVPLVDGRELRVAACRRDGTDWLTVVFPSGRTGLVPTGQLAQTATVLLDGQLHQADFSVTVEAKTNAPRADWMPLQPWELARRLKSPGFALYRGDRPMRAPVAPPVKDFPSDGPSLSRQFYYPQDRSLTHLLGALHRELPRLLAAPGLGDPLGQAYTIAAAVDGETAVAIAEAQVRLASPGQLPVAVARLAEAYRVLGARARLAGLLSQRERWRPPATGRFLPAGDAILDLQTDRATGNEWARHQQALLTGDLRAARRTLLELRRTWARLDESGRRKLGALPEQAESRLARFEEGLQAGLSRDARVALDAAFARLEYRLRHLATPLCEALATLDTPAVLELLRETAAIHGRQSDETADLLLYLIEQRRYDDVALPVDLLLWTGIHIKDRYDPLRAIPVFALAQKTGVLNRGKHPGQHALADQFVVEAGIYVSQIVRSSLEIAPATRLFAALHGICAKSVALATRADRGTKAFAYYDMSVYNLLALDDYTRQTADLIREADPLVDCGLSSRARRYAAEILGNHYSLRRRYEDAAALYQRLAAIGDPDGLYLAGWKLQKIGWKARRPDYWERGTECARQLQTLVVDGWLADRARTMLERNYDAVEWR